MSQLGPEPPRLMGLLALAWPVVVSRSSQVVVGFSDAVMVATLGEESLAATTTGSFNAFLLFILPMGTTFIVSSFSSQLFGRGRIEAARRYALYALGFAALTGLLLAVGRGLVPALLAPFDYAPRVRELMSTYLSIRLFAAFGAIGLEALANFYAGLGNTRLPMLANVLAMGSNVALNWMLIFGYLGAPAMGVAGAAWASVFSTTGAFLLLLFCFLRRVGQPTDATPDADTKPRYLREIGRMLRFGLPSGINWFLEMGAFMFFMNVVVAGLGTTALAAMNAVIQVNSVSFMPAFGLASAGAVLFGQNLGRGIQGYAVRAMWLTLGCAATWQCAVGLSYLLLPGVIMGAFAAPEATEFLAIGARILALSAAWQLFDAVANVLAESLRAAGDTAWTLWARIAIAWGFFVPASLYTVRTLEGGVVAAVICLGAYLGLLSAAMAYRFHSGRWKEMNLLEDEIVPM
ncbi:MAG: MATE family efflux transporter [Myxococcota bacterium]